MAYVANSKQAQAYLIDPMTAPEPAHDTGLNAHFTSTFPAPRTQSPTTKSPRSPKHTPTSSLSSNNPFRADSPHRSSLSKDRTQTHVRVASGGKERFPEYRTDAFGEGEADRRRSSDNHEKRSSQDGKSGHRRRTSSFQQRFPGDESNEPLKMLRKDSRKAYKSPHLRKHHIPGADMVDRLDPSIGGVSYHHEGPYDAALLARNSSFNSSPVAALESTNHEALKATPAENIRDAVERHRPLEGTAQIPSGMPDRFGRVYTYEEGADLMHEGVTDAGYKRWPGQTYHPDDLKGKGEPSFSLDRALKNHKIEDDNQGIELEERSRALKVSGREQNDGTVDDRDPVMIAGGEASYAALQQSREPGPSLTIGRSGSLRDGLKKRIGSLRHKKKDSQ